MCILAVAGASRCPIDKSQNRSSGLWPGQDCKAVVKEAFKNYVYTRLNISTIFLPIARMRHRLS